ncbi:CBS-domain-containing protein [Anaeromyces robustus]|uniref:CBS-domain-containing protein n=1 Tax=Anaeromyces robustus TaxID=1754192 RepID=A0A1Y1XP27_9FUNG|nr:CBS-domain-containing protein [Anaeromyces robustus]|eukprot:ORX87482.1 CBS-domain-containing protein [Anaeromyces robustus]
MNITTILKETKCCDLIKGQVPITIDSTKSVEEGCKELVEHQFTSAPIIDKSTGKIIGMLDYRDLVAFILLVFTKEKDGQDHKIFLDYDRGHKIKYIVENASKLSQEDENNKLSIHLLADLSLKNPTNTLIYNSPVTKAIEIFSNGIHRLILIKEDGSLYGILSQSDIVKYLASIFPVQIPGHTNNSIKWELGEKPISLAKPEFNEVITIDRYSSVMDALRIMYNSTISSIAIVENMGTKKILRGNISMTDIKEVIKNNKWRLLWYPVGNFFEEIRKMQEFENNGLDKVPVYTVGAETSVIKVIQKLAVTKGHRIWIVTEGDSLLSVYSLTDFMKLLKSELDKNQ